MSVVYTVTTAVFILIVSAMVPMVLLRVSRPAIQRADPARVARLEYELGIMEDSERVLYEYERAQGQVRFTSPTDAPGGIVRHRPVSSGNPYAYAAIMKEAWQQPFVNPNGDTYVVHEDVTGVWHEYSDGRRVRVRYDLLP